MKRGGKGWIVDFETFSAQFMWKESWLMGCRGVYWEKSSFVFEGNKRGKRKFLAKQRETKNFISDMEDCKKIKEYRSFFYSL